MGTIDLQLATELRKELELRRAVETGTFRGATARALAPLFDSVVTIELSKSLHKRAATALGDLPNVEAIQGHSVEVLRTVVKLDTPTLYFLDGHWSGGKTKGSSDECPLMGELAAIGPGHQDDCVVIDDARLFTSAPPWPYSPAKWPSIMEVFDAIRSRRPDHVVTLLVDQVIAVPRRARPVIDAYGARVQEASLGVRDRAVRLLVNTRTRVSRLE